MDIDLIKPHMRRHIQEGIEMGDMAMHAAVGEKADQMKFGFLCLLHGLEQNGIFGYGTVLHRQADSGIILVDDPPSADVEVAHLGVAHLSAGQTHRQARGGQGGGGVAFPVSLQVGLFSPGYGIMLLYWTDAKAIHDYYR